MSEMIQDSNAVNNKLASKLSTPSPRDRFESVDLDGGDEENPTASFQRNRCFETIGLEDSISTIPSTEYGGASDINARENNEEQGKSVAAFFNCETIQFVFWNVGGWMMLGVVVVAAYRLCFRSWIPDSMVAKLSVTSSQKIICWLLWTMFAVVDTAWKLRRRRDSVRS